MSVPPAKPGPDPRPAPVPAPGPAPGRGLDLRAVVDAAFAEHRRVLEAAGGSFAAELARAAALVVESYRAGGKALLFGNGGSMTDALHIEGELVGRFGYDRPGVPAIAFNGAASLTAIANDYGYEAVFARMVEAHGRPGDVALGLTTSGNSENVVRALERARALGLRTIAFTGEGGGRCAQFADACLRVPSRQTPRIQELHILAGHTLCELVERALFGSA